RRFEAEPPRPWAPKAASGGDAEAGDIMPAEGDRDQAYVALIESLSPKPVVAVGDARVPLAELDANRLRAWPRDTTTSQDKARPKQVAAGDLIAVRLKQDKVNQGTRRETVRQVAILAERPDVQAALVALDLPTGELRAMVGGYDYAASQFNRAVQAKRQIG